MSETSSTPIRTLHAALRAIRSLDYTIVFVRNMDAMRCFYGDTLGFAHLRDVGDSWTEYRIGGNILALTRRGSFLFNDEPPPDGALSVQLAFRVAPKEVYVCADALRAAGVALLHEPTDQPFGHRTTFFRDPDGNVLEIYAEL